MAEEYDAIAELHRLRTEAAQTRLRAIQSQLSLASTFCSLAETELRYGQIDEVRLLMGKLQHVIETIDRHLGERNHVPPDNVPECRDRLAQVRSRVLKIEAHLGR